MKAKRLFAGAGITAIMLSSLPVQAAPPPSVFKDTLGNVYVTSGVNYGDKVKVELAGVPLQKKVRAGACGQISIHTSLTMPSVGTHVTVNGTAINLSSIATASGIKCTATTGAFTPPVTQSYKDAKGKYVLVGYTAGTQYNVVYNDLPGYFNVAVNHCGFAAVKASTHPMSGSFKINGTTYDSNTLAVADPPLCKRQGTSYEKLIPASWQ